MARRSPLLAVLALVVAACSPAFLMPGLQRTVPQKAQQLAAGAALVASMPAPAHAGGVWINVRDPLCFLGYGIPHT